MLCDNIAYAVVLATEDIPVVTAMPALVALGLYGSERCCCSIWYIDGWSWNKVHLSYSQTLPKDVRTYVYTKRILHTFEY